MSNDNDRKLAMLLACFDGPKTAAKTRRPLEEKLRSGGDVVLDTTVLTVDQKHKASVHDPRRLVAGTLVPAVTWGLFGLVANGWEGLVIWGVLGAICGALFTYYSVHHLTKADLAHVGTRLPPGSSALLTFAETSDPSGLLSATAASEPSVASVAAIGDDLSADVFAGAHNPIELPRNPRAHPVALDRDALTTMIMLRYSDTDTAKKTASRIAAGGAKADTQVELIVRTDRAGHRHVTDPKFGTAAWAKSDLISWGAFGVVVGAISGAFGGGILKGGVVTGIAWGVFGVFAGALYGFFAGRSTSARRLKGIGPLLAPGTSMLLAWGNGDDQPMIETLTAPQSQQLVLRFNAVERGALIEAA